MLGGFLGEKNFFNVVFRLHKIEKNVEKRIIPINIL
jgi:hypothetical protein